MTAHLSGNSRVSPREQAAERIADPNGAGFPHRLQYADERLDGASAPRSFFGQGETFLAMTAWTQGSIRGSFLKTAGDSLGPVGCRRYSTTAGCRRRAKCDSEDDASVAHPVPRLAAGTQPVGAGRSSASPNACRNSCFRFWPNSLARPFLPSTISLALRIRCAKHFC
jgi:hypothetical protein